MKIKALLVDFDGVLVDSTGAYMKATNVTMKGFDCTPAANIDVRNISLEIARRLDLGVSRDLLLNNLIIVAPELITDFVNDWLKNWNEACLWEVTPILGAHEALVDLSKRFPLVLVTLRYLEKSLIKDQLRRLEFDGYFKSIITTLDVKRPKPAPDSLFEGAERLGVPIEDCAIVGDSITDIRAGKEGGARTIAVLSGIFDERVLKREKPDLIVQAITDISQYLE